MKGGMFAGEYCSQILLTLGACAGGVITVVCVCVCVCNATRLGFTRYIYIESKVP